MLITLLPQQLTLLIHLKQKLIEIEINCGHIRKTKREMKLLPDYINLV